MPRLRTNVGSLLVNEILPEDLRDYNRELGKKEQTALLRQVAEKYPERYREISHALNQLGGAVAYRTGGYSFGVEHLLQTPGAKAAREQLRAKLRAVDDDPNLTQEQRETAVLRLTGELAKRQSDEVFQEALAAGNPLALQVLSGARGKPSNLASLLASDLLYTDHRDRTIPVPILKSYSQGLSPAEYWAAAYGARRGVVDVKLGVADTGYLAKRLVQSVHRLMVTDLDGDGEPDTPRGLPVDINDNDNEGALLAIPAGGYPRNTILTPKILSNLRKQGLKRLLVRSPVTGGAPDGGVYARDVGVREFGRLPDRGSQVGITAAQALSEGISQGALSSKHSGGVAGAAPAVSGFAAIDQLVEVPKSFQGGATHAQKDGIVQSVDPAPTGGFYITVDNEKHYVPAGLPITVKRGDRVEAGDMLTEGLPNPAMIVQHKGIGEGRRYFIGAFQQAMRNAGLGAHRRNVELLSRGLIDHVRLTEERGDYAPDDVVPYRLVEQAYTPRDGFEELPAKAAVGRYLEKPYLHYSIGTKIRPSMLTDFDEFGVQKLAVHKDPPPFEPVMVRATSNMQYDPDWMTRMFGSYAKDSLLDAVRTGAHSDRTSTSFVPSLARGVEFGREGVIQPLRPFPDAVAKPPSPVAAIKRAAEENPVAQRLLQVLGQLPQGMQNAPEYRQQLQQQLAEMDALEAGGSWAPNFEQRRKLEAQLRQLTPYAELMEKGRRGGSWTSDVDYQDGDMGMDAYLDFAEQQLMRDRPGYTPTTPNVGQVTWPGDYSDERARPLHEQIARRKQLAQYRQQRFQTTGYTPEQEQMQARAEKSELTAVDPYTRRAFQGLNDTASSLTRMAGRAVRPFNRGLGQRIIDNVNKRQQELTHLVDSQEAQHGGTGRTGQALRVLGGAAPTAPLMASGLGNLALAGGGVEQGLSDPGGITPSQPPATVIPASQPDQPLPAPAAPAASVWANKPPVPDNPEFQYDRFGRLMSPAQRQAAQRQAVQDAEFAKRQQGYADSIADSNARTQAAIGRAEQSRRNMWVAQSRDPRLANSIATVMGSEHDMSHVVSPKIVRPEPLPDRRPPAEILAESQTARRQAEQALAATEQRLAALPKPSATAPFAGPDRVNPKAQVAKAPTPITLPAASRAIASAPVAPKPVGPIPGSG